MILDFENIQQIPYSKPFHTSTIMQFIIFPLVAIATLFGIAHAGPVNLEQRSSGLSCGPVILSTDELGYGDSCGDRQFTIGVKDTEEGQTQVVPLEDTAVPLHVKIRYCNSTYLGISGDTDGAAFRQDYGYVSFGKVFLGSSDEGLCVQRHETLPSSNPTAKTHITVQDCSTVDDATQARQFWYFQTKYNTANPIVKSNGMFDPLDMIFSNSTPPALLATRTNPNPNAGNNAIVL
ncbi:uncharacterized protein FA14DRAFT_155539 [Meira miltonrushii]|uniref:Uncharacterized protein n=1 Tax=Meira miltonrushii TaxID=1280837 RepID=A0A316VF41_9BASI|nr:uncharacterized protein FA14DRAFT_155539 [Meira miltonrushii]PWN36136.1 hypothetical protein FA14DRAFT_155539 [Meira miltonrushii]